MSKGALVRIAGFVIRISVFLRVSSFVIRILELRFMERGKEFRPKSASYTPRLERQRSTAPTAWKMKLGSQRIKCGANSGRVSSDWPTMMKL